MQNQNSANSAILQALYRCLLVGWTIITLFMGDVALQHVTIGRPIKDIFAMMDTGTSPLRFKIVALHNMLRSLMVVIKEWPTTSLMQPL